METETPNLQQFLRLPRLVKLLDVSPSFVHAAVARKVFPAPVRLGDVPGSGPAVWCATDIARWQAERIAASGGAMPSDQAAGERA